MNQSARSLASATGARTYSTGLVCKHGHASERYTANGHCVECQRQRNKIDGPKWRAENPQRVRENNRRFYERDPGYNLRNRKKNWGHFYARRRADPNKRLAHELRAAISGAVRRGNAAKSACTTKLLGCDIHEFRKHIEALWFDGMTWENWGRGKGCWHLDHRRPISSFDLTDPAQQRQCFSFRNYQPLWADENIRKGARLDWSAPRRPDQQPEGADHHGT